MNLIIKQGALTNVLTDSEMIVLLKVLKGESLTDEEELLRRRIIKFLTN